MEFLTLQDVPHFHRSAMSFRDSSPPHHCAKPQEASERMQGTANGLPPFKELARVADKPHEEQSVTNVPSPTSIGYWQTSSARNSRQSSTERHLLNRPTTIEFSNPFGAPSARLPSSPENYTTQNAGRPSFHHARSSPTHEHRRSSARSRFEPRIPSLHSALVQLRKTSESGPLTTRPAGYHPSGAYAHQLPLPSSPPDIRRASEAPYAHHGYGSPYGNEHYTYRSSWVPEASSHQPRYQPRHDSTMAPYLDPRNPYSYQPPYPHNLEHGHHGMVDGTYTRRRRGNLPKEATLILKKWFQAHAPSPYPTDEEKNHLAGVTGLTQSQISNWFINARRRNPGKEARDAAKRAAQHAREDREMDVDHDRNPGPRPQPQDGLQLQRDRSRRDNDQPDCEDREMNDA